MKATVHSVMLSALALASVSLTPDDADAQDSGKQVSELRVYNLRSAGPVECRVFGVCVI